MTALTQAELGIKTCLSLPEHRSRWFTRSRKARSCSFRSSLCSSFSWPTKAKPAPLTTKFGVQLCTWHRKILPVPLDLSFPIIITRFFGHTGLAKGLCRKAGGGRKPKAARRGAFPLARQAALYLSRPLVSSSETHVPES